MSIVRTYEGFVSNNISAKPSKKSKTSTRSTQNKTLDVKGMNDGGMSNQIYGEDVSSEKASDINSDYYKSIMHYHNIYDRNEINLYDKTYRFGVFNPYGALTQTKEFLFFTKPDLHIFKASDETGLVSKKTINPQLANIPFWADLAKYRKNTIRLLQSSYGNKSSDVQDPFNHLLQNQVISNLEIPALESDAIETASNVYGVNLSYRGSSESSDDNLTFSLEFKDSKWLDVYYFFKAYEEYETLKHHGSVTPYLGYIINKVLHDQFAIYKFLVDDDMETILYYGKYYGVMPTSLPRDVFSNSNFDGGLSYSINFKAAFYEDMRPEIISDFNSLSKPFYNSLPYRIDVYNNIFDRTDSRAAKCAIIEKDTKRNSTIISPTGFTYKLKWRGSDKV